MHELSLALNMVEIAEEKAKEKNTSAIEEKILLGIEQDILDRNQKIVDANSLYFKEKNILCLNLMSSPG
ncbi:MAG: hypothetical protein LBE91_17835 [Tannerella sp.]|jgi:Zn finger protein HypA/HybF involved in hydrogenase expression|nr:hypothetical protein [Tannerella sp.]